MEKPMTMHEKNLAYMREREQVEADIPNKVAAVMAEVGEAFCARFFPGLIRPERMDEFSDWLQSWLRERFPECDDFPRIAATLEEGARHIGFPSLAEWLNKTIREQELAGLAMRNIQPARVE